MASETTTETATTVTKPPIINPYKTTTTATMGVQSQLRKKATTKMKERPRYMLKANEILAETQAAAKQTTVDGTPLFVPEKDCIICRVVAKNKTLPPEERVDPPHRKHPERCPNNKKTNGLKSQQTLFVESYATKQQQKNTKRPSETEICRPIPKASVPQAEKFFDARLQPSKRQKSANADVPQQQPGCQNTACVPPFALEMAGAKALQCHVDRLMQLFPQKERTSPPSGGSQPLVEVAKYIREHFFPKRLKSDPGRTATKQVSWNFDKLKQNTTRYALATVRSKQDSIDEKYNTHQNQNQVDSLVSTWH